MQGARHRPESVSMMSVRGGHVSRLFAAVLLLCACVPLAASANRVLAGEGQIGVTVALGERPQDAGSVSAGREIPIAKLPKEARETLALIKRGGPFPYRKDGSTFGNREKRLPLKSREYYREYTVPTPGSRDRGARRIVAGRDGEYYYTDDHYNSFKRIRE